MSKGRKGRNRFNRKRPEAKIDAEQFRGIHPLGPEIAKELLHREPWDDICKEFHVSPNIVSRINKALAASLSSVAEPKPDSSSNETQLPTEAPQFAESRGQGPQTAPVRTEVEGEMERYGSYNAKELFNQLSLASGINAKKVSQVVQEYERNQTKFDENPFLLLDLFATVGLSHERSVNVLRTWLSNTDNKYSKVFAMLSSNPEMLQHLPLYEPKHADPLDDFIDFQMKVRKMRLMADDKYFDVDAGRSDGPGAVDGVIRRLDRIEEKLEKSELQEELEKMSSKIDELEKGSSGGSFVQKAQDALLVRKMFFDEGSKSPQSTVAVIEEEPVLDEEGKQKVDADGAPVVRRKTVYQPIQTTAVHQKEPDELDELMEKMTKIAMVKMITGGGPGMGMGGMMGGMGQTNPFMAPLMRPMLNEKNEVIYDKYGQPQMEITGYATLGSQGAGEKTSDIVEGMKVVAEVMKPQQGSDQSKIVESLLNTVNKKDDQALAELRDQVRQMQGNDPLQYAVEVVGKLKGLGIIGGEKPENFDIAKMRTDFDKWKTEHEEELTKWIWQQKEKQNDQKFAREQMAEVNKTLREGIQQVGKPLAESFGKGFEHGAAKNAAGPQQAGQHQGPPAEQDVTKMSKEELHDYLTRAQQAEEMVEKAKNNIIAELHSRGEPT